MEEVRGARKEVDLRSHLGGSTPKLDLGQGGAHYFNVRVYENLHFEEIEKERPSLLLLTVPAPLGLQDQPELMELLKWNPKPSSVNIRDFTVINTIRDCHIFNTEDPTLIRSQNQGRENDKFD
ncbi:hypothetical protein Syun_017173 [Stephania yunnanensis]|uniref:Uncharacterized protein n=1 Tax=Stephania yunnanensis TaxID=152371 RepID=A0AAP0J6G0_9MAGN